MLGWIRRRLCRHLVIRVGPVDVCINNCGYRVWSSDCICGDPNTDCRANGCHPWCMNRACDGDRLSFDEAEAAGYDGTGRDLWDEPRWSTLTAHELWMVFRADLSGESDGGPYDTVDPVTWGEALGTDEGAAFYMAPDDPDPRG